MKRIAAIALLAISAPLFGQDANHVTYFTRSGQLVEHPDSAYYSVTRNFDMKPLYIVSHYLQPAAIRSKCSAIDDAGNHIRTYYYPNGKMMAISKFTWNSPVGAMKAFYSNGSIQSEMEVPERKFGPKGEMPSPEILILNYWDSLKNQVVKNGEGRCTCKLDPFENSVHTAVGEVHGGLKTGTWTGTTLNGALSYQEVYNEGILVSGESRYKGETFQYKELESSGSPRKGMTAFYRYVGEEMRYPKEARRMGVEGKVFVEFIILPSGELSDIKVIKGIGAGCDEEAVRVISTAPAWEPGHQRGRKVKQRYTMPIVFKLG